MQVDHWDSTVVFKNTLKTIHPKQLSITDDQLHRCHLPPPICVRAPVLALVPQNNFQKSNLPQYWHRTIAAVVFDRILGSHRKSTFHRKVQTSYQNNQWKQYQRWKTREKILPETLILIAEITMSCQLLFFLFVSRSPKNCFHHWWSLLIAWHSSWNLLGALP